jgi:hypothetical protein
VAKSPLYRQCALNAPNQTWVADITNSLADEGWPILAMIED